MEGVERLMLTREDMLKKIQVYKFSMVVWYACATHTHTHRDGRTSEASICVVWFVHRSAQFWWWRLGSHPCQLVCSQGTFISCYVILVLLLVNLWCVWLRFLIIVEKRLLIGLFHCIHHGLHYLRLFDLMMFSFISCSSYEWLKFERV